MTAGSNSRSLVAEESIRLVPAASWKRRLPAALIGSRLSARWNRVTPQFLYESLQPQCPSSRPSHHGLELRYEDAGLARQAPSRSPTVPDRQHPHSFLNTVIVAHRPGLRPAAIGSDQPRESAQCNHVIPYESRPHPKWRLGGLWAPVAADCTEVTGLVTLGQ